MSEHKNSAKKVPKKYQPKGLTILFEDRDIIVVNKTHGLLTISTEKNSDNTAYSRLTDYVKKGNYKSHNRVFIVHRLDKDTSGVLVFAKTEQAKKYLQDEWQKFNKTYFAVVHGKMRKKEAIITSYLTESKARKMYSVRDHEKGKLAKTEYKVIKESEKYSLVEIKLLTGKKNQIRVHFSERGHPLVGDKKYGKKEASINRMALHSASITLLHPHSKKEMTFNTEIPDYFESLLGKYGQQLL